MALEKLFHVVLDNARCKMYDLHMDTESELAQEANRLRPDSTRYACAFRKCSSAFVDELADLNRCEKCDQRVCESHSRKRSCYNVCETCDTSERAALAVLMPDEIMELADKIRNKQVTAEEVVLKLEALKLNAEEIEGQQ